MSLDQFRETIQIAGKPLDSQIVAFGIDGKSREMPDMRKYVELGECNSCDYFLPADDSIILIEETQLLRGMKKLRKEYGYLNGQDRELHVNRRIREENRLKVYGSLLTLCRLRSKCDRARRMIDGKRYKFWLVVSDSDVAEVDKYMDSLQGDLYTALGGALSKKVVDEVDVLPANLLTKKLTSS